jgi:flagellar biosynthesis regulator FlaF
MPTLNTAARAYAATAAARSHRDQEADLFRRVGLVLRRSRAQGETARVKALADNQRLWTMVLDLLRDPGNALPAPLRGSLISVGLCLQREMQTAEPDLEFLAAVNENIAAGLAGTP